MGEQLMEDALTQFKKITRKQANPWNNPMVNDFPMELEQAVKRQPLAENSTDVLGFVDHFSLLEGKIK